MTTFAVKLQALTKEAFNHIEDNIPKKGFSFCDESEAEKLNKESELDNSNLCPRGSYYGKMGVLDVFIVSIGEWKGQDTEIRIIVDDEYTANQIEDGYFGNLTSDTVIVLADAMSKTKYSCDVTKILDIQSKSLPEDLEQKVHKYVLPTYKDHGLSLKDTEHLFSVNKMIYDKQDKETIWVQGRLNELEQQALSDIVKEAEEMDCAYIRFLKV